ncbi:MAG: ABC transporter ATP-binding protein [Deltaproteobacteria bacterium]|nr:ABC transporter ATP-binding protein [Deltaproteobacteria bacterium]
MSEPRSVSVHVNALSHRYPGAEHAALSDVSLQVQAGERVGLLGPNGAGKSTLMRLATGFLPISGGPATRVELAGLDVRTRSRDARACVGYLPEHVPLYHELRAREHLSFRARIKGVPRRRRAAEIERVAEQTGIADVLHTPVGQLSRGYRQRVGIADALLGAPPVVILDEPTVGLDPNQVRDMRSLLRELGGAHTLVFSSHILAEVEMLCDRVVILARGKVVLDEELATATGAQHVVVQWAAPPAQALAALTAAWESLSLGTLHPDVVEPHREGSRATVLVPRDGPPLPQVQAAIGQACCDAGLVLLELRPGRTRLEERFVEVTTQP